MLDTRPILLAALLTAAATAAAAQTCRDLVDRLAEQHALHAAPPAAPDTAGLPGSITPEELARSGGAIQPPPTGDDAAVIAPPPTGDPMPTAPPLEGSTSAGELAAGDEPAHQAQVEALLAAARAAAEQGDEPLCRERLEEAQNLIAGVRGG
jgi:hypothetical protein